jgi:hypothetical protein
MHIQLIAYIYARFTLKSFCGTTLQVDCRKPTKNKREIIFKKLANLILN